MFLLSFSCASSLIISQIEVEGKEPQPGPLHTVLTSLYADFFFRGPTSLKKKANALAAYWEPFWPAYKAANPGIFEGFPKPVNAFVNINLVPFKHQAPIGGFTMLFTAVGFCSCCSTCALLTLIISSLPLCMSCAPQLRQALHQPWSPNAFLQKLFKRSILNPSSLLTSRPWMPSKRMRSTN